MGRDFHQAILEASSDIISVLDPDGRITYVSSAVTRVLGYEPAALLGEPGVAYHHPADRETVASTIEFLRSNPDETRTVETRFRRADGSWCWIESKLQNRTADDAIGGILVNSRDITDRMDGQLRDTTNRFQVLFEKAPEEIAIHDTDGDVLAVNQAEIEGLGYSRAELTSMNVAEFQAGYSRDELQELWAEIEPGEMSKVEGRHERKDGSTYPVAVWMNKVGINGDERILAFVRDITERKQHEAEIRRLKTRLELAVEGAELGVWDWDMTTDQVTFNDQWAQMLGYSRSDLEPRLAAWRAHIHPEDREDTLATLEAHIAGETEYYDTEYRMQTAAGEWKWIRDVGRVVERDGGEPVRAVGVSMDIDDRKQREQQLRQEKERLDEFASVVSHDLRNPLNVAQGRVELARAECETEHLDAVTDAIDRSLDLVADMLELARAGQEVTTTEPVAVPDLTTACWDTVETADATVRVDLEATVRADRSRLRQLLENLFRNAVEHGGEDVTIRVGPLPDGFYLEDDGPGIPVDDWETVWEAGHSGTEDGTGFGLSIVKEIAEAHEWEISVAEGSDGGARFEITGVEFVAK